VAYRPQKSEKSGQTPSHFVLDGFIF